MILKGSYYLMREQAKIDHQQLLKHQEDARVRMQEANRIADDTRREYSALTAACHQLQGMLPHLELMVSIETALRYRKEDL